MTSMNKIEKSIENSMYIFILMSNITMRKKIIGKGEVMSE
jgi:hypothetical protein